VPVPVLARATTPSPEEPPLDMVPEYVVLVFSAPIVKTAVPAGHEYTPPLPDRAPIVASLAHRSRPLPAPIVTAE